MSEDPSSLSWMLELERCCDEFELAWRSGKRPDLNEFLRSVEKRPTEFRQELACELLKIELAYRVQSSEKTAVSPNVEELASQIQASELIKSIPVDLVVAEYRIRRNAGETPSHDDYKTRFPSQWPDIQRLLEEEDAYERRVADGLEERRDDLSGQR